LATRAGDLPERGKRDREVECSPIARDAPRGDIPADPSISYFFFGTLAPARRASDNPMAIACLRLVTLFPEPPDRSVPRFRSRITRSTFCEAFFPYRRPPRDFLGMTAPFLFFVSLPREGRDEIFHASAVLS
jgi:hypothetical protein